MYNSEPKVKIIADSIFNIDSTHSSRLVTFELQYWRAILPELNTHRAFSRCTVSNRAMPTDKLVESIKSNPWGPNHFFKNCKGMEGKEEYSLVETNMLKTIFTQIATSVAVSVENVLKQIKDYGFESIHKQTINRLLEPYQSVKTVLTADTNALEHFFKLRCAKDAQPEMQDLANEMRKQFQVHEPKELKNYDMHLPYITPEEEKAYLNIVCDPQEDNSIIRNRMLNLMKASAMRCARVSYDKLDGSKASIAEDSVKCDTLISKGHMSPLEHVCIACPDMYTQFKEQADKQYKLGLGNLLTTNVSYPFVQLRRIYDNGFDELII